MDDNHDLEDMIIENKPVQCELCDGKMYYIDGGRYKCHSCGYEMLDNFGKIKQFIEEYGIAPANIYRSCYWCPFGHH